MLFIISINKQSLFSIAVIAAILSLRNVGSNSADSLSPPKNQNEVIIPLPEADQDWLTIRDPNCNHLYIDKTQFLWNLLKNNSARRRLITRPRRFGKTLFLQMTQQFFRGNKILFEGLFIGKYGNKNIFPYAPVSDTNDDLWMEYPVINLNFRMIQKFNSIDEFMEGYYKMLETIAREYKLQNFKYGHGSTMCLIRELYLKFNFTPVVVLVDEYDSPYHHAINENNEELAKEIRDFLGDIFGMMKNEYEKVGFLLIFGISKITLDVLQSDANNIIDETHNPEYAEAFGFTEEEITNRLTPHIEEFAKHMSLSSKDILDRLKYHYDGYQFDLHNRSRRVFNPVSTLTSIRNKKFERYWIRTASMNPILEMFYREGWILDNLLNGVVVSPKVIAESIEHEKPHLVKWMFHNGYLTVDGPQFPGIGLKIPNMEIEAAINTSLLSYDPTIQKRYEDFYAGELVQIRILLDSGSVQQAITILQQIGFVAYAHPLSQQMEPAEVHRRLDMIFDLAGINHENGIAFKTGDERKDDGGDIDMWTNTLSTNYAIKIETTNGTDGEFAAIQAMEQMLNYLKNYPEAMLEKLGNPANMFLLGLAFELHTGSAKLTSWIFLPASNGRPDFDKFQSSSDGVACKYKEREQQWKSWFDLKL